MIPVAWLNSVNIDMIVLYQAPCVALILLFKALCRACYRVIGIQVEFLKIIILGGGEEAEETRMAYWRETKNRNMVDRFKCSNNYGFWQCKCLAPLVQSCKIHQ